MKTNIYLFLLTICIALCSCRGTKEQYILLINNRDCLNCEALLSKQFSESTFNSILRQKKVKILFPNVRRFEQDDLIIKLNLPKNNVVFDSEKYDFYVSKVNFSPPILLRMNNDSIVEAFDFRDTLIYSSDFLK